MKPALFKISTPFIPCIRSASNITINATQLFFIFSPPYGFTFGPNWIACWHPGFAQSFSGGISLPLPFHNPKDGEEAERNEGV